MNAERFLFMDQEWILEEISVECYSGYKGEESPRAFIHQGKKFEISAITDRWFEGGMDPAGIQHNYFKVRTSDGDFFLLRHTPRFQSWMLCRRVPAPAFSDN